MYNSNSNIVSAIVYVVAMGVFLIWLFYKFARRDTKDWTPQCEQKKWKTVRGLIGGICCFDALGMVVVTIAAWNLSDDNLRLSYINAALVYGILACYTLLFRKSPRGRGVKIRKTIAYIIIILSYFGWPRTVQMLTDGNVPGIYGDAIYVVIIMNLILYGLCVLIAWLLLRHYKRDKYVEYKTTCGAIPHQDNVKDQNLSNIDNSRYMPPQAIHKEGIRGENLSTNELNPSKKEAELDLKVDNPANNKIEYTKEAENTEVYNKQNSINGVFGEGLRQVEQVNVKEHRIAKTVSETKQRNLLASYLIYILAVLIVAFIGCVFILNKDYNPGYYYHKTPIWSYIALSITLMALPFGLYWLRGKRLGFYICIGYLVYEFILSFFVLAIGFSWKCYGIVFLSAILLSVVPILAIWIAELVGLQIKVKPLKQCKREMNPQIKDRQKSLKDSFKKILKKTWPWVVGILILGGLTFGGIKWYDYYRNEYLPKKRLNDAVEEIKSKFDNSDGDEKADIAYKILRRNTDWGYEGVSNVQIHLALAGGDDAEHLALEEVVADK
ncbi:MAG: hypothetical protein IJL38_06070 [Bacteroidales bacterium]|nr:hypothetical protein [Bacteroidales bacterium]